MSPNQETELLNACRILFPSADVSRDFLCYIQPQGLKNAYRHRAWELHPDVCIEEADQIRRTELFRRSVEAYNLLNDYLKVRKPILFNRKFKTVSASYTRTCVIKRPPNELYYSGTFPTIELKTGLYLYYSGAVSYEAVVRALLWQRNQRPPLGDFAREWGWMCNEDIAAVLDAHHIPGTFGERALELGFINKSQLNLILLHQRTMQQPIGRYFVSQSILSELLLRNHLRGLARHNKTIRSSHL